MANRRKSNRTSGKKVTTKTSSAKRNEIKENGAIQDEIILVVAFVVSVLLFLSNFDLGGPVGKFVSDFIFGLIGFEAYLLPLILFFGTALHISNPGNKRIGRKILSAVVFFIALAALIQLISTDYNRDTGIFKYYTEAVEKRNGGGLIGGIIVMFLYGLFDKVATYIILIAIMVIAVIVITGKAIFTYIAKKSKSSIEERMEYQKLKKEQFDVIDGGLKDKQSTRDNIQDRRPAKTFDLSPSSADCNPSMFDDVSSKKDKHKKRSSSNNANNKDDDELPIINLDHLFPEDKYPVKEDAAANKSNGSVLGSNIPTYEEELKNKFSDSKIIDQNSSEHKDVALSDILMNNDSGKEPSARHEVSGYNEASDNNERLGYDQSRGLESYPGGVNSGSIETSGNHEGNRSHESGYHKSSGTSSEEVEPLDINQTAKPKPYVFPPMNLLNAAKAKVTGRASDLELKDTAIKLQSTLESFGVHVTITNISRGPSVTRYELQPEQGVKVKSITSLSDDIKLNLAAAEVRIEAPIPGKSAIGIEVPNKENSMVTLREMFESREFREHPSDIAFAVGKDIGGQNIITDIAKMPHLLIAGATGSGKSVCINTLIMSIIYKANPSDVRLIMVDPKVVELNVYNGIPHLLIPVVTDPKKASAALSWAVMEMTERYKKFADIGVRDLKGYNEKVAEVEYLNDENYQKLPQIVIIIDELSDLMMVAPGEVEDAICRLAQMARAAGLHLIIATQRPSVNVITGLIKANIPSRIAFAVSSQVDSRTIIDGAGAEKLLGKGDMLFFPSGYPKPVRIQGAFVSDKEVSAVVDYLKSNNNEATYSEDINEKIINARASDNGAGGSSDDRDDYFAEAGRFIIEKDKASIGMLQRVYRIGFNRAARIMDQLAEAGVVGPEEGTKPRKVLMSPEQFDQYLEEN